MKRIINPKHMILFLIMTLATLSLVRFIKYYETSKIKSQCKSAINRNSDLLQIRKNKLDEIIQGRRPKEVVDNRDCYAHFSNFGDEFSLTQFDSNDRYDATFDKFNSTQTIDQAKFARFNIDTKAIESTFSFGMKNAPYTDNNECKQASFNQISIAEKNNLQILRELVGINFRGVSTNHRYTTSTTIDFDEDINTFIINNSITPIVEDLISTDLTTSLNNNLFLASCNQSLVALYEFCYANPEFDMQFLSLNYLRNIQSLSIDLYCKKSNQQEWTKLANFILNSN